MGNCFGSKAKPPSSSASSAQQLPPPVTPTLQVLPPRQDGKIPTPESLAQSDKRRPHPDHLGAAARTTHTNRQDLTLKRLRCRHHHHALESRVHVNHLGAVQESLLLRYPNMAGERYRPHYHNELGGHLSPCHHTVVKKRLRNISAIEAWLIPRYPNWRDGYSSTQVGICTPITPIYYLATASHQGSVCLLFGKGQLPDRKFNNAKGDVPHNPLKQTSRANHERAPNDTGPRPLTSTMRKVLSDDFRHESRHSPSRSGKSSLISSVFKVDMAAAPKRLAGDAGISLEFRPRDNLHLIVHEYSGFESGDVQNLKVIRDFITDRTNASLSSSERLHAIWICLPTSDAIDGTVGEGVEEILSMRKVVIIFTKFDMIVSQILFNHYGSDPQHHERARASAYTMLEERCRSLFHRELKDLPGDIFSTKPTLSDVINGLVTTTDKHLAADPHNTIVPSVPPSTPKGKPRASPVLLAWSAAQRGRESRYWRSLGSSPDFTDRSLENCVSVIHDEIVEVWNLPDKDRYLWNPGFKAKMAHLVKDLTIPHTGANSSLDPNGIPGVGLMIPTASWLNTLLQYRNICCIMGYIVDLTVILHKLFGYGHDVSPNDVQSIIERHGTSGDKNQIHDDIRRFIKETPAFTYRKKDLIMERIVDLIAQFCVPSSSNSY
ncbi:hypothetical protein B0F90DRAFT_1821856 [Multifurca ochricompacta]|uniref:Uncharacterized protein n=1 Tax=Multifurca ochricompacta TaxID=376703 RepID=A0AAD4QK71_9AGAM|nr:hypothetical protein B0F90DRAFT_1821856 [Multifurca ochricompacta]